MKPLLTPTILLLLLAATACYAANPTTASAPLSIHAVHTWGDLLKQTPISLPSPPPPKGAIAVGDGPLKVRIGIDAADVQHCGYVLLYCLASARDAARIIKHFDPSLGPFTVTVDSLNRIDEKSDMASSADGKDPNPLFGLFMAVVPLPDSGRHTICLQRIDDPRAMLTIASADVVVPQRAAKADEPAAPWCPWKPAPYKDEPNSPKNVWIANDINPSSGAAVPVCDQWAPIYVDKQPDAARPLPQLIGDAPDPGCGLTMQDDDLIVALDQTVGVSYLFPEQHFLTRWWVNGKPFIPSRRGPSDEALYGNGGGGVDDVREFHFHMTFHPDALAAKKGDTIGVQLLYCPHGWEYIDHPQMMAMDQERIATANQPPPLAVTRMTNRINFIYSGDPVHPQSINRPKE